MGAWQEVLAKAGFPERAVVLDFETYWAKGYILNDPKMSIVQYILDPRFEITALGVKHVGEEQAQFGAWNGSFNDAHEMVAILQNMHGKNYENVTLVGQNLPFDAFILQEHYGITPKYTVDIRDLSKMWDARASHHLKDIAQRWKVRKPKGDTKQFLGYRAKDITGQLLAELRTYTINDVDIEEELFIKMLPVVVSRPEVELPVAAHTLKMYLGKSFQVDAEQGRNIQTRMALEMARAVGAAGAVLGYDCGHEDISRPSIFVPAFAEILKKHGKEMPMKLSNEPHKKTGKKELIPALAKDDQAFEELLICNIPEIRILAEAKSAVSSWPGHIAKVASILRQAHARGGIIGAPLGYHNSHTARWGGTGGINLQNLGGRGRAGRGTHPLVAAVRGMLASLPNYILAILDWAAIEARILAWFAGQDDLTVGFHNKEDIYSVFATELFKEEVRKPKEGDPPEVYAKLSLYRGFGKDAILGCGYGMGANRFYGNCYINPALRPYFDDGTYDWDFIDRLIKLYRKKYHKIPKFWNDVERAWRFVAKYPNEVMTVNNLTFWAEGGAVFITLPSGRDFRYPNASVNLATKQCSYKWGKLWGGAITENIVQATARDMLAEAILRLDANDFRFALHVHDECVLLLPVATAEKRLREACDLMTVVPDWAEGLPVDVEGDLCERYKK